MNAPRRPRVLLADDHRMVAEALKSLLAPDFELVGVVESGLEMVVAAASLRPDVIVADVSMPQLNGIDALVHLRQRGDPVPVVFLTMHREANFARRALEAGASGFVLKHSAPAELVSAIRAALAGRLYVSPQLSAEAFDSIHQPPVLDSGTLASLTPRQREVLQLVGEGKSAKQVAATLGISPRTAEFHKYQAMEALGLHSNAELIRFAIEHGTAGR